MSSSGPRYLSGTYPYSSLSMSAFEVRLVTVHPPEISGGLLSVHMLEYQLATAPVCVTVSYTWGRPAPEFPAEWDDETSTLPILLNGSEFRIDALYINQNDPEEKNVVVLRMTEIYTGGRNNIVWLGPHAADGSTQLAFAKMSSLMGLLAERSDELLETEIRWDKLDDYAKVVQAEFPDDEGTRLWDAIQSVWARSWWRRAWVVQEVAKSRNTIIMCGDSEVHWEVVETTLMAIGQHETNPNRLRLPNKDTLTATIWRLTSSELSKLVTDMMACINRVTDFADRKEHVSLLTNLDFIRITSSTDERDKVYAAFGISDPDETTNIDHNLPVRDVYTKVARKSIEAHKGYAILSFCKYPSEGSTRLGLPTWVPDWADRKPQDQCYEPFFHTGVAALVMTDENIKKPLYRAAGGSILENLRFEDDGLTLVVPGVRADKLTFIASKTHDQESQTPKKFIFNMPWLRE